MQIALIADLHFGTHKDDLVFLNGQVRFYKEQLVPELKAKGITELYVLGDVYDDRKETNIQTDNIVLDLFQNILKDFNIHIIVGNHDMYMNTTAEINSLKGLNLLPNVTVYEKPTDIILDGKKILLLPWVIDYTSIDEIILDTYDYCFCHMDIIGFDVGGGRLSESGVYAKNLLSKINHVYSGHYHTGYTRTYEDNKSITYLGSPYQLTRIDRDLYKGYTVLDIETNQKEWIENTKSCRYYKFTYPDIDNELINNNIIDIDIPYEYSTKIAKINTDMKTVENLCPCGKIKFNILPDTEAVNIVIEENMLNIVSLFDTYLKDYNTKVDKKKLKDKFMVLYNNHKDQT